MWLLNFLCFYTYSVSTKSQGTNNEIINSSCQNRKVFFRQFLSILTGYIFMVNAGVHNSWPSSALPYLTSEKSEIPITFDQSTWLACVPNVSAILGIIMSPFMMDNMGRKYTTLVFGLIQIFAWIIINCATNFFYLCLGRVVVGIAYSGIISFCATYIAEIASKDIRGAFLLAVNIFFNFGGFLANTAGALFSYKKMNLVLGLSSLIALGVFPFAQETPYFYLLKKRDGDAIKALMKLSGKASPEMVMEDIARIKESIEQCKSSKKSAIHELFTDKSSRRALIITLITYLIYAFSGDSVIQSYTKEIFDYTGSSIDSNYATMLVSGVQLITGSLSSCLIDCLGRKSMYLLSGLLSAICLIVVGLFFYFKLLVKMDMSSISWIPLMFLILFQIVYNIGISTIPFVYLGELFSFKVKGVAITIVSIFAVSFIFISVFVAPFLNKAAGIYTTFWVLSSFCIIGPLIIVYIAPETKGKNLEEILEMLRAK